MEGAGIWGGDKAQQRPVHVLEGHTSDVDVLVYAPGGGVLASGSRDETIRLVVLFIVST